MCIGVSVSASVFFKTFYTCQDTCCTTLSRRILHHTTLIDLCATRPFTSLGAHVAPHIEAHITPHHIEPHVTHIEAHVRQIEAHVTPYHTRLLYHYTTCVAVCCSMMQRVAGVASHITRSLQHTCCSVVQCVTVCCRVSLCVAVCCRVLQCVAVWCRCVAVCCRCVTVICVP